MHGREVEEDRLDQIEITHRHAAAGEHDVAVGDQANQQRFELRPHIRAFSGPNDLGADRFERGSQHVAIRVADLPQSERFAWFEQLISRRDDGDPGLAPHGDRIAAVCREHADLGGTYARARTHQQLPGACIRADLPHAFARRHKLWWMITLSSAISVFSTLTTASAPFGSGAPVMILIAVPGVTSASIKLPADWTPTTSRQETHRWR
ncbi:MAG: hypothetical protein R2848_10865 [Thermomicrobiales bacterium]